MENQQSNGVDNVRWPTTVAWTALKCGAQIVFMHTEIDEHTKWGNIWFGTPSSTAFGRIQVENAWNDKELFHKIAHTLSGRSVYHSGAASKFALKSPKLSMVIAVLLKLNVLWAIVEANTCPFESFYCQYAAWFSFFSHSISPFLALFRLIWRQYRI